MGRSRVGKSHFARQVLGAEGYYPKLNNKWWDGYQSQKVVIMEDVDKENGQVPSPPPQDLGGPLGFIGETKGARLPPFTDGW